MALGAGLLFVGLDGWRDGSIPGYGIGGGCMGRAYNEKSGVVEVVRDENGDELMYIVLGSVELG